VTPSTDIETHARKALGGVGIVGVGSYLPERVVTNEQVEVLSGYSREEHKGRELDQWVRRYHGGLTRHRAAPGQATSDLATEAARRAIADAGLAPDDIDVIVMATVTSDHRMPSSAAAVQANLGVRVKFFQVDSACTGFLDSIQVAIGLMRTFDYGRALVVCADATAAWVDPRDWLSMSVFGDGAAAVVLGPVGADRGFRSLCLGAEGDLRHFVCVPAGGSRQPITDAGLGADQQYIRVQWQNVHRWAVDRMTTAVNRALTEAGITVDDVSWMVPHQASAPIIRATAAALELPLERVVLTYPLYGNTAGSSLPIALDHARREGLLRDGQWLVLPAVGAGMAWGAAIYRWFEYRDQSR
jgi:3-oxoacyl-[acyl-carrier-protein] synthase-3